jgi:hypothetical protein
VQRVDITGDTNYISFKTEFGKSLTDNKDLFFIFENPKGFIPITDGMSKDTNTVKKTIEQQITDNLAEQFTSNSTGLGFVPSIRNILAIFYCQGEAFLRLLDEVHKKSWDQRNNKYRRAAIFGNQSTAPSVDIKTSTQNDEPIYPWPQVLKETTTDDNKEKFELVYPGDLSVASTYNAFNPEVWPEVEFVEEFITGYVKRQSDESKGDPIQVNLLGKPKYNATGRGDVGEELSHICREKNYQISYLKFDKCEIERWELKPGVMFGNGSMYEDLIFHNFHSASGGNIDIYIKNANKVLEL